MQDACLKGKYIYGIRIKGMPVFVDCILIQRQFVTFKYIGFEIEILMKQSMQNS